MLRVRLCGGIEVEAEGRRLPDALFAGRQGRLAFAYLVCERDRSVPREELAELLWGDRLPASWTTSLSAVVSKLRKLLAEANLDGNDALPSAFGSYRLHVSDDELWVDFDVALTAADDAERALHAGDAATAIAHASEAAGIAERGFLNDDCAWVDQQREKLRDVRVRAALVRAEAHLSDGAPARAADAAREAVALDELREAGYRLLMRSLAAGGERAEALRVWERCRTMLVEELGVDPSPETEAVYLDILGAGGATTALPSGVVTFLLTDIVESSTLWERQPEAMATALERHDRIVAETVAAHGGTLLKTKLEGDATVSVFTRASAGATAALALLEALSAEGWPDGAAPQVRMALHTGEAFERGGDYFGPALNRAARLRSLADANQILLSQAVAELVHDHLRADAALVNLGHRDLRGLSRGETVYELRAGAASQTPQTPPRAQPRPVPTALSGSGPFVGRELELHQLAEDWEHVVAGRARAVLIAGEPGVGKTRLAGEWARRAHEQGALVLYGRCDEDLGAPYQPFAEAIRAIVPSFQFVAAPQGDPDAERSVLFDGVAQLLTSVAAQTPIVLVLDDLHWAAKPTLLLLRHVLRFAEVARLQIIGTYRNTDLDRTHPLAATLADLHRDGAGERVTLTGLPNEDVNAYLVATGHDDEDLGAALSSVTAGNPFFLIEALRHVEESGGTWDARTLPQGVREAVGRRVSRLSDAANDALLAGAVVGATFELDLVEKVLERDLVDAIEEACHAGIVVEEHGGRFRFNHAIVRRSLLAEVASVKKVRLHQKIAENLEKSHPDDPTVFADLAHHYFESAWAGNAGKALVFCKAAADQAMSRLAYEEAADLYDRAIQALEVDGEHDAEKGDLLLARCEALLATGDAAAATAAVADLKAFAAKSKRLTAWAASFAGQLAVLTDPGRLEETEREVAAAAETFGAEGDHSGEAKAHTVRSACLARMGRYADCETALDHALTAARRAHDNAAVNAVLAGAPLAALWGPSPVPRAGGRCLDVIRLLRITTGSPAVEVTSICCQAVLEAFRGRAHAARRMLDKASNTLRDLGLRHELLKLELFAGVVELVDDHPEAAERHLQRAYDGFTRLGLDTDTAVAAALLARAYLALARFDDADSLCARSEELAGHDLKASIAWRTVRARLLARDGAHDEARRVAEAAVALAARTDALVDHGDAVLALSDVLAAAGNAAGARDAASRAAALYERKGASTLAARIAGPSPEATSASPPTTTTLSLTNACVHACTEFDAMVFAQDWDGLRKLLRDDFVRKNPQAMAGPQTDREHEVAIAESTLQMGVTHVTSNVIAIRGDRLSLRYQSWAGDRRSVASLRVSKIDVDGRLVSMSVFGTDELADALVALDEAYLADEGAQFADTYRAIARGVDDFNHRRPAHADLVFVDHRAASAGTVDAHSWLSGVVATAPDSLATIVEVHRLTADAGLITIAGFGTAENGVVIENGGVWFVQVADGRWRRAEIFAFSDLDAAMRRFDEHDQSPLENTASAACHALARAVVKHDVESAQALVASGARFSDRRRVVGIEHDYGVDTLMSLGRWNRDGGDPVTTTVATRGDRVAMVRVEAGVGDDGATIEFLVLVEVDAAGLIVFGQMRSPEDLDAAFALLEQRYVEGEAAAHADTWRTIIDGVDAFRRRDESVLSPDLVYVDHRPVSIGTATGAEWLALLRGVVQTTPDAAIRVAAVHRLTDHGAVLTMRGGGTSRDGVVAEQVTPWVVRVENGRYRRVERFVTDDLTAALNRFDELERADGLLDNACARLLHEVQVACAAGDWRRVRSFIADDAVAINRVTGSLREPAMDPDEFTRGLRGVVETLRGLSLRVIATRGDRLALFVASFHHDFGTDDIPQVARVNVDGKFDLHVSCPDADAAFEELDALYLATLPADEAATMGIVFDGYRAFNERQRGDENLETIDHRRASFGETASGPMLRLVVDTAPDMHFSVVAVHRVTSGGAVISALGRGTSAEGVEIEEAGTCVFRVEAGRRIRFEVFDYGAVMEALARFDELERAQNILDTACTRAGRKFRDAVRNSDWATVRELIAPDARQDNRVPHELRPRDWNVDRFVENMQAIRDVTPILETRELAVRGERLSLTYLRNGTEIGFGDGLHVLRLNEHGQFDLQVIFPSDDHDAAYEELDRLYLEGEAASYADVWTMINEAQSAIRRRDLGAIRVARDYEFVDHRGAYFGRLSSEEHAALIRAGGTPGVDTRFVAVHHLDQHGAVYTVRATGTSGDTTVDTTTTDFVVIRDGSFVRMERFNDGDVAGAIARYRELTQSSTLENACTRKIADFRVAVEGGDWDAVRELIADDGVSESRTDHALREPKFDGPRFVDGLRELMAQFTIESVQVRATRGERLAVFEIDVRSPEGYGWGASVQLARLNEKGKFDLQVIFGEDLHAAITELDALYAAGEGAQFADTHQALVVGLDHFNRRIDATSPDLVLVDHRKASFGTILVSDLTDASVEVDPDVWVYVAAIHRINERGAVISVAATGQDDARVIPWVVLTGDGKWLHAEVWDTDGLDTALQAFDAMMASSPLENACTRAADRFAELANAGDWDAVQNMVSPGVTHDDRRRIALNGRAGDRALGIEVLRTGHELGGRYLDSEVIAIRGERLALRLSRFGGPGGVDEALRLIRMDESGRLVVQVVFDVEDEDAALAELDAQFIADEAGAHAEVFRVISGALAAFNRREPNPYVPRDSVLVDHRPASWGPLDPITSRDIVRSTVDALPNYRQRAAAVYRLARHGAVLHMINGGHTATGAEVEFATIGIAIVENGKIVRRELFPEGSLEEALARFDELGRQSVVENECTRAIERFRAAIARDDWASAEMLHASDFVAENHVTNALAPREMDRAETTRLARESFNVFARWPTARFVATRGNRLALEEMAYPNADGMALRVREIGDDGLFTYQGTFDGDDLEGAFAVLDERFMAGEGLPYADVWRIVTGVSNSFNGREPVPNFDAIPVVDHRLTGVTNSREASAAIREFLELVPDARFGVVSIEAIDAHGAVAKVMRWGTTTEGAQIEIRGIALYLGRHGALERLEFFDETDLDAALARFAELTAHDAAPANAATEISKRLAAAVTEQDWDAIDDLIAPDWHFENRERNPIVRGPGRPGDLKAWWQAHPGTTLTHEAIAVRGDRLALDRQSARHADLTGDPAGPAGDMLFVTEVDELGRCRVRIGFESDDLDAAFTELDARYLEGEAAPFADVWRGVTNMVDAFNERRSRKDVFTDDAQILDHREIMKSIDNTGERFAFVKALWDLARDARQRINSVLGLNHSGALAVAVNGGTTDEGNRVEMAFICLVLVRDGKVAHLEFFDERDTDDALARFEALTSFPEVRATVQAMIDAFNNRDFTTRVLARDYRYVDHRKAAFGTAKRADVAASVERVWELVPDIQHRLVETHAINERGLVGTIATTGTTSDGVAMDWRTKSVYVTEAGRLTRLEVYEDDELDAALARFEELTAANDCARALVRLRAAIERGDWSAVEDAHAASFIAVNNGSHPLVPRLANRAQEVEFIRSAAEMGGRVLASSIVATRGDGLALSRVTFGGGVAADTTLRVRGVDAEGRFLFQVCFDEDDLDFAMAELEARANENLAVQSRRKLAELYAQGAWDEIEAMFVDDFVFERYIQLLGPLFPNDGASGMRQLYEEGGRQVEWQTVTTRGDRLGLFFWRLFGDADDFAFERGRLAVSEVDADGRFVRSAFFELESYDEALALLEEWAAN